MSNAPSNNIVCSNCSKKGHIFRDCSKFKGCGKCKQAVIHTALSCSKNWPKYDEQVCDYCFDPGHEHGKCTHSYRETCKTCGHDHTTAKCPFGPRGILPPNLADTAYNQFTRTCRDKHLEKYPQNVPSAAKTPPADASSSQPQSGAQNSQDSSLSVRTDLPIVPKEVPTAENLDPDPEAARRKKWAEAEKKLPRRAPADATSATNTGSNIKANFFEIAIDPAVKIFKYSITLGEIGRKPADDSNDGTKAKENKNRKLSRETKRFLITRLLEANPPLHGNWATDYDSTIVSNGELYGGSAPALNQVKQTPHSCNGRGKNAEPVQVDSFVTYLGEIKLKALKDYVEKGLDFDGVADVLTALNIISWKKINNPSFEGGRVGNRFYPERKGKMKAATPDQLYQIRDGFFSSMRPGSESLLLNVNTVTSAFFSPMNLQAWIEKCWPKETLEGNLVKYFRSKFKGIRVTLDIHDSSRLWQICGMSPKTVRRTYFLQGNAQSFVSDYLRTKYNVKEFPKVHWADRDWDSFCINVGGKAPGQEVWYPASRLTIVDWQIVKEKMQGDYSDQMLKMGEKPPQVNKNKIGHIQNELGLEDESFYKQFGLTPSSRMVVLTPKLVRPPTLLFDKQNKSKTAVPKDGEWNLAQQDSFIKRGEACTELNVIYLTEEGNLGIYVEAIRTQMKRYSLSTTTKTIPINDSTPQTLPSLSKSLSHQEIEDFNKKYRDECQAKLINALTSLYKKRGNESRIPFMLVVLPERSIPLYAEVKRWADGEVGIPTVCITVNKLKQVYNKAGETLLANICLKINSKLKGASHGINPSGLPATGGLRGDFLARESTMIAGADVTHPKQGLETACPSIVGVVATDEDNSSCYLGSARLQKGKQEEIFDLAGMMKERVMAWYKKARQNATPKDTWKNWFPKHILFYRDGVSESQYGMVLCEEKDQILAGWQKAFDEVKEDLKINKNSKNKQDQMWVPKLTLLVVTKRHHARFYPFAEVEARTKKVDINLKCGHVIDTKVVHPIKKDFYLQSHHSALGTARSGHYVVIHDDNNYSLLELQQITNSLCYVSARATKAVSVCVPARYADLLCDRLRCYMRPALEGYLTDPADEASSSSVPVASTSSNLNASSSNIPDAASLSITDASTSGAPGAARSSVKDTSSPSVPDVSTSSGPGTSSDTAPAVPATSLPDISSSSAPDGVEDLSYIKTLENDKRVWKVTPRAKNPWDSALDDCMFYV